MCMKDKLVPQGLLLADFQLKQVTLDPQLASAVSKKVAAQQLQQQQAFDLADRAEAGRHQAHPGARHRRRRADHRSAAATVTTVTQDGADLAGDRPEPADQCTDKLTPAFLQFTYIQALQALAAGKGTSTLVLPFDKNLTPLINLPSRLEHAAAARRPRSRSGERLEPVDGRAQAVGERDLGTEAEVACGGARVGAAVAHVAGAGLDELRVRLDAEQVAEHAQDVEQRRRLRRPRCCRRGPRTCSAGACAAARFAATTSEMNVKSRDCSPSPCTTGSRAVEQRVDEERDHGRVRARRGAAAARTR